MGRMYLGVLPNTLSATLAGGSSVPSPARNGRCGTDVLFWFCRSYGSVTAVRAPYAGPGGPTSLEDPH